MDKYTKQLRERYLKSLEAIRKNTEINPFESEDEKQARIKKAQGNVGYFVKTYLPHYATSPSADFHIALARYVQKNQTAKVIVKWGRGLAKSVWADLIIPLWLYFRGEDIYMVLIGKNERRAKQLLSDVQAEFEANQLLKNDMGNQERFGDWEEGDFQTQDGRFIAQALGMLQTPRGLRKGARRPNYIVGDDLEEKQMAKNPQRQDEAVEWIEGDLLPTMDGNKRRYLHVNNNPFVRSILGELEKKHPDWKVHQVKAYNPVTYEPAWASKYDTDYYKSWEHEIGVLAAKAEFNNEPHRQGKIFMDEQIQWAKLPRLNSFATLVGHWDIAYAGTATSDYNAVRLWGLWNGQFYYIDGFVRQSKMKAAVQWMADYQKRLPKTVRVHWRFESQFWNDEVKRTIDEVEKANGIHLDLVKVDTPRGKKYDRILTLQPYYQNSRIYYNENLKGNRDCLEGINQLKGIEPGYRTHDDAPDADQQAIQYLNTHIFSGTQQMRMGKMRKNNERRI